MKAKKFKAGGGAGPRLQQNWDWRAASNFICGGAGGGLLFAAALLSLAGIDVRALLLAGMALIGIGAVLVSVSGHLLRTHLYDAPLACPHVLERDVHLGQPISQAVAGYVDALRDELPR